MKLALNIILIVILAVCAWTGFKRGVVRSLFGLVVVIISLILGNVVASQYSKELVSAIEPFLGGYIDSDSTTESVLDTLGFEDSDRSLNDILEEDPSLRYDYAYETLRMVGFYKGFAEDLATDCVSVSEKNDYSMTEAVTTVACNTASYVGCLTVAFVLILAILTAIVDIIGIEIRLPGAPFVDETAGAIVGLMKGVLYCVLLCWVLGFLGSVIGKSTADETGLVRFFLAFRFITRSLI